MSAGGGGPTGGEPGFAISLLAGLPVTLRFTVWDERGNRIDKDWRISEGDDVDESLFAWATGGTTAVHEYLRSELEARVAARGGA